MAPFKRDRMTWIKPSFLWMMYRCGWATKPGQERVLAIDITRDGFEWALARACLSHYDRGLHGDAAAWSRQLKASPVRVQWDPERALRLHALPYRSLQVGLSGEAVDRYVDEWIVAVEDITPTVERVRDLLRPATNRQPQLSCLSSTSTRSRIGSPPTWTPARTPLPPRTPSGGTGTDRLPLTAAPRQDTAAPRQDRARRRPGSRRRRAPSARAIRLGAHVALPRATRHLVR